ncbi:von Willebrand factor A domain-containing protein 5A-like, partial [Mercenaria mercenaria]|uniref:von Willebrand factor A domain-containing protein 5A-like n=1 Tax=Mercenaria mercenaria TaxID=6596 RepID=UPI00234EFCFF
MSSSKSNDSGGKNESKPSPLGLITEKQRPVSVKSVKVDVHITGYVAEVSSRLTYINKEKTPVDTVFTFPANDGSAVFLLEADIGKCHIVADVQRKEQ